MCGRCCHGLRLPLTVSEALAWVERGGEVEIFCDAIPWPSDPPGTNPVADYKRERSFLAYSGELPIRVTLTLMATFAGPCPNLGPQNRCAIYDERPLTCRIYPAEVNPFIVMEPKHKLCPPEAWTGMAVGTPEAGALQNVSTHEAIAMARSAATTQSVTRARLASILQLDRAGLANEGVAIHSPDQGELLAALRQTTTGATLPDTEPDQWCMLSDQPETLSALLSCHAKSDEPAESPGWRYLSFLA